MPEYDRQINNPAASYPPALDFATRSGVLNYQFKRLRSKLRGIEPKEINIHDILSIYSGSVATSTS